MTAMTAVETHETTNGAEPNRSSIIRVEIQSDGDLNDANALPAYTLSAAEGESTLDAEAYRAEKSPTPGHAPVQTPAQAAGPVTGHGSGFGTASDVKNAQLFMLDSNQAGPAKGHASAAESASDIKNAQLFAPGSNQTVSDVKNAQLFMLESNQAGPSQAGPSQAGPSQAGPSQELPEDAPPPFSDLPPDYFTELTNNAAVAHTKKCSILKERPATWLINGKDLALCPLAATVLIKEGLLKSKHLDLVAQTSGAQRDPTDPLSGAALGVYDTVSDILLGLVQGPIELGKQVAPMIKKEEAKLPGDNATEIKSSESRVSLSLRPSTSRSTSISTPNGERPDASGQLEPARTLEAEHTGDAVSVTSSSKTKGKGKAAMGAAGQVAKGTGKGFGRMIGAGFKAPMAITHGLTRGFHNVPKLYGEEVREYENVVDIKSGVKVSAKNFGYGLADGISDFFVKPIEGAQKEGVIGFGKGFGKGIGNLVCKPTAGVAGIIGYSSMGVYKQISGIKFSNKKDPAVEVVENLGEAEYEQANEFVRKYIVRTWCEETMKHKNGHGTSDG